jgi:tRNA (adenine37-N6)-methyltransferase
MEIIYRPIGIVHSPYKDLDRIPRQPTAGYDVAGTVEIHSEFVEGLKDLEGFSHIILLCHLHRITRFSLTALPPGETVRRGVFATRSPRRPNPIGLSIVRLQSIQGPLLHILDLDILDGTPVLDIKPFFRSLDEKTSARTGWAAHDQYR